MLKAIIAIGNGISGIKDSIETNLKKRPSKLKVNECARFAAVVPSLLEHKPNTNSRDVLRKAGIAFERLNNVILFPKK